MSLSFFEMREVQKTALDWPVSEIQICVLFWILILNSQKSNNNFCAGFLWASQEQTAPTIAEMDFYEIWIQKRLKLKTEERWKLTEVQRSFCQPMIASEAL